MATNYERGRQYEYKSMRYMEVAGYDCVRTAGSHGPFDIVAISAESLALVQVKFQCNPTEAEIETFRALKVPTGTRKLVHRWDFRKREPRVTVV